MSSELYLAYDTETTGLPVDYACGDMYAVDNWPRVYQVGAILFDLEGMEYGRVDSYIKPDKWAIPVLSDYMRDLGAVSFHEEHGITTEMLMDVGRPMFEILREFRELADQAGAAVCHNVAFDRPIMVCEMYRGRSFPHAWEAKQHHCTKLITEPILQIPGNRPNTFKWPTLMEAYKYFYEKEFTGAHGAISDAQATADVFLEIAYSL